MPYPSQITEEAVIETAREMIEAHGVDNLSLHKLAAALGVKAPSLYRYFRNKMAVLRAVNDATFRGLVAAIVAPLALDADAETKFVAIAHAFRDYAHAHPVTYGLAYTNTIDALRMDDDEQEEAVLPFQALMTEICGEADSLPALRGLWAMIHGFVALELAAQFRRGGDLDATFEQAVRAYLRGWQRE